MNLRIFWHKTAATLLLKMRWPGMIPFFAFPDEVRRLIYTTDSIKSLNAKIRRAVRTRGHFASNESTMKLVFLVLRLVAEKWRMPAREWMAAKAQFAITFEHRFIPQ